MAKGYSVQLIGRSFLDSPPFGQGPPERCFEPLLRTPLPQLTSIGRQHLVRLRRVQQPLQRQLEMGKDTRPSSLLPTPPLLVFSVLTETRNDAFPKRHLSCIRTCERLVPPLLALLLVPHWRHTIPIRGSQHYLLLAPRDVQRQHWADILRHQNHRWLQQVAVELQH